MLNTSAISTAEARYDKQAHPPTEAKKIKRVCVYGGSGVWADPTYRDIGAKLGQHLASAGVGLVYGGGTEGLMGTLARSVFDRGGEVTAVVTMNGEGRQRFEGLHRLVVVQDVESRKREMQDAADVVLVLPGGVETLRNLVDCLLSAPVGLKAKPIVVFDLGGFWQPLLGLIEHMNDRTFIRPEILRAYDVCHTLDDVLAALSIAPRPASVLGSAAVEASQGGAAAGRPTSLPLHLVDQPSDAGFSVYEVQPG